MTTFLEDEKLMNFLFGDDSEELAHYGTPHEGSTPHSGRYAWGSGALPNQHPRDFISTVNNLKQFNRLTEEDIALGFGFPNVEQYRVRYDYEKNYRDTPSKFCDYVDKLRKYKDEDGNGYSEEEIARMVNLRSAKDLEEKYGYSKAVWEKVPEGYKVDSDFDKQIKALTKEGYSDAQIALGLGVETSKLKALKSIATNTAKLELIEKDRKLMEGVKDADGNWIQQPIENRSERARILGLAEGTLRSMENGSVEDNSKVIFNTADILRQEMQEHKYVHVGKGAAERLGIKPDKLNVALEVLKLEGYNVMNTQVEQLGSQKNNKTSVLTLVPPGVEYSELKADIQGVKDKETGEWIQKPNDNAIHIIGSHSEDGGETFTKFEKPTTIDSNRIYIKYAEEGGTDRDGLIELRRGVDDISLNKAAYAQVRISVDDKYYLKGMAMHTDDIPDGYDIVFNTNKKEGTPMEKVFKELKDNPDDPSNPFGATIRLDDQKLNLTQRHYIDSKTGEEKLSAINVVNEEGDWSKWSKAVASQVLGKQKLDVIKKQLDLTYEGHKTELDEIMSLTNPVVKQKLLDDYAETMDKAAVDLKAISFPRQSTRVLLPFPKMKEDECYLPGYENGEKVALIRYPHAGAFEIPVVTVNNKFKEAKDILGNAIDAIGIHPKTASTLSGADFDGDTALAIPIRDKNGNKVTDLTTSKDINMEYFDDLKDFDTKKYKLPDDIDPKSNRIMKTEEARGKEMGKITNLIADMTLQDPDPKDLCNAVKYSMVIVDAYKHKLDWKKAYKDFDIKDLKKKYRATEDGEAGGAASLLTRAKSPEYVDYRREKSPSNMTPEEKEAYLRGEKVYDYPMTTRMYRDKDTDELKIYDVPTKSKIKSYRMAEEGDAKKLISETNPTQQEYLYALFANQHKDLARAARKESRSLVIEKPDPEARKTFKEQVDSLKEKLRIAKANAPLETKAHIIGNRLFANRKEASPNLDDAHYRKIKAQCLDIARKRVGANRTDIVITPKEWEAIQKRAISASDLREIMRRADMDVVRQYATPRAKTEMSNAQIQTVKTLLANNYEIADVAKRLGISVSTIYNNVPVADIRHSMIEARSERAFL